MSLPLVLEGHQVSHKVTVSIEGPCCFYNLDTLDKGEVVLDEESH